ncbi:MAG: prolipoprotein diacylglyceryl transferase [candidate division KSB1 bacterium]|nr:prolipoprotein diacylglyceryl transferase [candidate division KSB1 bacterium]MDZ7304679.1 prolipoprotein diacylglyceryl transferase [candidate division KSB1 bacterium]MDZ7313789.1 prolipoprotein diacylglyceryl transferase [candidate division KSB1 bacterium]
MYPDLFTIPSFQLFGFTTPSFTLHSFGLMAMLGFLIPTLLMRREFEWAKIDPEMSSSVAVAAIIGGFIGARLYYIIENWHDFLKHPGDYIFTGAGLVWYGGLFGGALAVILMIRHHRLPFWKTADIIAPMLLLGQAFGRMGCLLSGDGDYGPPSDAPWAMRFPNGIVPTLHNEKLQELYKQMHPGLPVPDDIAVHPTPLYEIIFLLAFFAVLWKLRHRQLPAGTIFGLYFITAGIGRFVTEFWRNTPKLAFGWMTLAQMISMAMMILGLVIIFLRKRSHEQRAPQIQRVKPAVEN